MCGSVPRTVVSGFVNDSLTTVRGTEAFHNCPYIDSRTALKMLYECFALLSDRISLKTNRKSQNRCANNLAHI
jgi:hypothetical protein